MAAALGLLCLGLLIGWMPHYLTWPWSRDPETWAVIAQSWDHGILPYRDIRAFNFPGVIYLAWILGKVFGWGHTVPLYAFDAGCLVLLGVVLAAWSRRRLGGTVPGLIGYLAFLYFYLNLQYDLVAQRDWHTALLLCLGLLLMQAWPGRLTRLASAITAALALVMRPHAVLFLPAYCWEVAQGVDVSAPGRFRGVRAVAVWCLWFGVFVAMAFGPLVLAGIVDDFVRGLGVTAYGGAHNKASLADAIRAFADQFKSWRIDIPLIVTLLLAAGPRTSLSRIARTWSWVWLGVLFYFPIHPAHHLYLRLPILLVSSITWALAVSWLLSSRRIARPLLVFAIMLLIYEIMPSLPWMCNYIESVRALGPLLRNGIPTRRPVGCLRPFQVVSGPSARWTNYRALLMYIRSETSPRTLVANLLYRYPYETINGPTGHLSPFRAESGICWMTQVDLDLDSEFAQSLIDSPDSVVVWYPRVLLPDPRLELTQVRAVIPRYYEPAAKFGYYEVWRRKPVV